MSASETSTVHDHLSGPLPRTEPSERARERGKALRSDVPRSAHGELRLAPGRDVLGSIERTNAGRIAELVPVRTERMSESAFAFFRATAGGMADDLAAGARTGIDVMISGDAHLTNFGLYATPERRLVFDLNDFDEAGIGPWEWDVKRLATSLDLVMRGREASDRDRTEAVAGVVSAYRDALRDLVSRSALDRYFSSVDAEWLAEEASGRTAKRLDETVRKAKRRTSEKVLDKITTTGEGGDRHIVADPPLLVPLDGDALDATRRRFARYLETLDADRALLISQFRVVDVARRVVGVGSVGTRCSVVLLAGPSDEPLVLQVKEAGESVLEPALPGHDVFPAEARERRGEGFRVVACQRILQSASDPFLGWTSDEDGVEYYWRQFRDMKGGVDLDGLGEGGLTRYARLCARLLARAHSQSPEAAAVAGYLGTGDVFAESVARWCDLYSEQVLADYAAFVQAIEDGRFPLA